MSMPSQIQDVLYSVQVVVHCRYPGQRVPSTLANISRAKRLGGKSSMWRSIISHVQEQLGSCLWQMMAASRKLVQGCLPVAYCITLGWLAAFETAAGANAKRGEVAHDHIPVWLQELPTNHSFLGPLANFTKRDRVESKTGLGFPLV